MRDLYGLRWGKRTQTPSPCPTPPSPAHNKIFFPVDGCE
jgi:hypothetical protein